MDRNLEFVLEVLSDPASNHWWDLARFYDPAFRQNTHLGIVVALLRRDVHLVRPEHKKNHVSGDLPRVSHLLSEFEIRNRLEGQNTSHDFRNLMN